MIQQHPGITIEDALTRESPTGWVVMTLQSPLKERETMLDESATVLKIFATIKFEDISIFQLQLSLTFFLLHQ